jgi:hypothetical protein
MINTTTIKIYTVEYWQNNWETLIERVENGEHIGIKNEENGQTAVMIPADDKIVKIHTILKNDAS